MPNTQKVLFMGTHAALLQTLRLSAGHTLSIEQITENAPFQHLQSLTNIGMVVVQHCPPTDDGFSTVRNCKRHLPNVPVVVLTSDYTGPTTKLLMKSGAEDVFSMSAQQDDLLACFETYVPDFKAVKTKPRPPIKAAIEKTAMAAVVPGLVLAGAVLGGQEAPIGPLSPSASIQQPVGDAYKGLEVSFFGTFTARFGGHPLVFTAQAKSLFAYLAYNHNRALSSDHLAKVFWPDKYDISPEGARRSLNVELTHIRNTFRAQTGIQTPFLTFEKGCYRLQFGSPILSDVQRFKALHQKIQDSRRLSVSVSDDLMQDILNAYQGNFLDDFPADTFNWVEVERQHLSSVFEQVAELYTERFCESGDFGRASAMCEELLTRDPRLEVVYRRGMVCYANQGKLHKVKSLYELYCKMMMQEFGSAPSADIAALYQELMRKVKK
jgi:DNA-binding SARP family transcriptional activator/CheY-like chemotaxis protein